MYVCMYVYIYTHTYITYPILMYKLNFKDLFFRPKNCVIPSSSYDSVRLKLKHNEKDKEQMASKINSLYIKDQPIHKYIPSLCLKITISKKSVISIWVEHIYR